MRKTKNMIKVFMFLQICLLGMTGNSWGEEVLSKNALPLWELGLFNGAVRLPHYRGADEYKLYVLPLPYLVYRGKFIQSDKDGVKGIFFKTPQFESSISLSGNPPVDNDNKAREGMPELNALFEVGPALKWFFRGRDALDTLCLQMAARGAFSINFDSGADIAYQGLHGSVHLVYNNRSLFERNGLSLGFNVGTDFADHELNSYFYDVSEDHVLPGRHFYESDGGYAGFSASANLLKTITKSLSLGMYCRWDNMSGTVSEDSPLVKEKNNFVVGCALIWKIAESGRLVNSE